MCEDISLMIQKITEEMGCEDIREALDIIDSMKKDREYLERHPYAITKNKDGRFSTRVRDENAPEKRRKIIKQTREDLEKAIIEYYKERDEQRIDEGISMRDFYPRWIKHKSLKTNSSAYIKTIQELWDKFYTDSKITDVPLNKLDKKTLENWALSLIRENDMTKTKYYNTTVIVRQLMDYAVDCHILSENVFRRFKVDRKLFRHEKKKPNETQVFNTEEMGQIIEEAFKDYEKTKEPECLGIPFLFLTGLRISECVSIMSSDINEEKDNHIHIQRMEVVHYTELEDGKRKRHDIIAYRVKSDDSNRNVYLPVEARNILEMVMKANKELGYHDSDYIFLNKEGRIHRSSLNSKIRTYCRRLNIPVRGLHKIRKTYISTLIDNENLNINYIREQVGHKDERTTFNNYCFDRHPKDLTEKEMEKTLNIYGVPMCSQN